MGFFNRKQKEFSKKSTYYELLSGYKKSEKELEKASKKGDSRALRAAMEEHQRYEYALLYRNTPEYERAEKRKYECQSRRKR